METVTITKSDYDLVVAALGRIADTRRDESRETIAEQYASALGTCQGLAKIARLHLTSSADLCKELEAPNVR